MTLDQTIRQPAPGRSVCPEVPTSRGWAPKTAAARETRLLGRQSIFTLSGERFGERYAYELLYRSSRPGSPVDTWSPCEQDEATRHVVVTALSAGLPLLCGARPAFVNATRSLLVGTLQLPPLPTQVGIEVVESVLVDDEVLAGVRELRGRGHLISVDDFAGGPDQVRLLPHADLVKIDIRDLHRTGPDLLRLAQSYGATTVIERVETPDALRRCQDLGFDLVQGNLLEPALVLDLGPARPSTPSASRG